MEDKRTELMNRLNVIIENLYQVFETAASKRDVDQMLLISDKITKAAGVIASLYHVKDPEEQIAMLEKVLSEAEA